MHNRILIDRVIMRSCCVCYQLIEMSNLIVYWSCWMVPIHHDRGMCERLWVERIFTILMPQQNDRHFPDVFKLVFLSLKMFCLIQISLNFVPNGPTVHKSTLIQVMAWRLPEPVLTMETPAMSPSLFETALCEGKQHSGIVFTSEKCIWDRVAKKFAVIHSRQTQWFLGGSYALVNRRLFVSISDAVPEIELGRNRETPGI